MSSRVCVTGHIQDPMSLIEKKRGLSPGGRFPPGFIHQVIIITGLNKLYDCMFSPWGGPGCRLGVNSPLKLKTVFVCESPAIPNNDTVPITVLNSN